MTIIVFSVHWTASFRGRLLRWYGRYARSLPWRANRDPYRIWVSEIMLQQTRVATAVPYFERFLESFPDVESLAGASEDEVLAAWSGLGYYSRARNMRKAAHQIVASGSFPNDYESIRRLPGVGDYTAAAIASIAFDLPRAVMDGNVRRVLSRLTCQAGRLDAVAASLVAGPRPGQFNQALMELGATVCLPGEPLCPVCPVSAFCGAKRQGRQREFPVKLPRPAPVRVAKTLLLVEKNGKVLLWKREDGPRMRGFWELPEAGQLPGALPTRRLAEFRHSITNHNYVFTVIEARVRRAPAGFRWVAERDLDDIPLSTVARKALALRSPRGNVRERAGRRH